MATPVDVEPFRQLRKACVEAGKALPGTDLRSARHGLLEKGRCKRGRCVVGNCRGNQCKAAKKISTEALIAFLMDESRPFGMEHREILADLLSGEFSPAATKPTKSHAERRDENAFLQHIRDQKAERMRNGMPAIHAQYVVEIANEHDPRRLSSWNELWKRPSPYHSLLKIARRFQKDQVDKGSDPDQAAFRAGWMAAGFREFIVGDLESADHKAIAKMIAADLAKSPRRTSKK